CSSHNISSTGGRGSNRSSASSPTPLRRRHSASCRSSGRSRSPTAGSLWCAGSSACRSSTRRGRPSPSWSACWWPGSPAHPVSPAWCRRCARRSPAPRGAAHGPPAEARASEGFLVAAVAAPDPSERGVLLEATVHAGFLLALGLAVHAHARERKGLQAGVGDGGLAPLPAAGAAVLG